MPEDVNAPEYLVGMFEQMAGSRAIVTIAQEWTPEILAEGDNWLAAVQLGAALLLGRPLLFVVRPGDELCPKLAAIADRVVEFDPDGDPAGTAAAIRSALEDLDGTAR